MKTPKANCPGCAAQGALIEGLERDRLALRKEWDLFKIEIRDHFAAQATLNKLHADLIDTNSDSVSKAPVPHSDETGSLQRETERLKLYLRSVQIWENALKAASSTIKASQPAPALTPDYSTLISSAMGLIQNVAVALMTKRVPIDLRANLQKVLDSFLRFGGTQGERG